MANPNVDDLTNYFTWLSGKLANGSFPEEKELSQTIGISNLDLANGTLLQWLGYDNSTVQPEYSIRIGSTQHRVDFLIGKEPHYWMLELKSPSEDCDNQKWIEQLQSYLQLKKMPLGVLFNGNEARAYIYPDHKTLARIASSYAKEGYEEEWANLSKIAVKRASVQTGNIGELVDFFRTLRCDGTMPDIVGIAKKLAQSHLKLIKEKGREKQIRQILNSILREPDNAIVEAIINASAALSGLSTQPKEVLDIWKDLQPRKPPTPVPPGQLNPLMREKIAQICEKYGYEALKTPPIPHLKMALNVTDKGYKPVPQRPRVPQGLSVQGVDGNTARQIIKNLEHILKTNPAEN